MAHNPQTRSGTRRNGNDRALNHLQDDLDQRHGTDMAAPEAEHGLQSEPERFPRVEEDHVSQFSQRASLKNEKHEHTAQDKLVNSEKGGSHKQRPLKRRQQWSPYDTRGRDDLRALAVSLQKSLESSEIPGTVDNGVDSPLKPESSLPVSPLIQALERKKPTKSSPKDVKKDELAKNPWATMLASPLRLCAATGVRLPKDLLVPWGLVRNPATSEVYFMPTELADLESLKDKRRSSKPSASALLKRPPAANECPNFLPDSSPLQGNANGESDGKRSKEPLSTTDLQNKPTEADIPPDDSPSTSQASKSPLVVYMLPSLPLLHHLTHRFTYLQKDMVTRRSKPNAINSILPWRLKARIERANFYAVQREKISLSSDPKEAANAPSPSSFQDVKWGLDIDEVMLRILRERLLAALEMLGNRNQKLWRQKRELVKATCVTRTSDTNTNDEIWTLLGDDEYAKDVNEMGEGSDVRGAKICLLVESNDVNSPILQQGAFVKHEQVNEEERTQASTRVSSHFAEPSAAMNDGWRVSSDLQPSTIQLDRSSNVPLFPLNYLFGTDYISRFRQLSAAIGVLAPRKLPPGNASGHAYVLIIPASAFGGNSVIEEVWRLWRFLGGSRA